MDTNKMREQFEAWFESSGMEKFKETAWAAWQASREAVVVELPDHFRPSREEVIAAIQAQGLKVAP